MQKKIDNGLKYVIQSLCVCRNNKWPFPLTKKTLSDQFRLQELNLQVPKTALKVDNSAALRKIISRLMKLRFLFMRHSLID